MTNERSSPDGLPLVTQGTVEVFFRDYEQQRKEGKEVEYTQEMAARIARDNPELGGFFRKLYQDMEPEKADQFAMGAGCMYEILRRQAEAYNLGNID